jgi:hypothetical protein
MGNKYGYDVQSFISTASNTCQCVSGPDQDVRGEGHGRYRV